MIVSLSVRFVRAVAVLCIGVGSLAIMSSAHAGLAIANGDFSNVSGLTSALPWYHGVPAGWNTANSTGSGTPLNSLYSDSNVPNVANLAALTKSDTSGTIRLWQAIGSLDVQGPVRITFDIRNLGVGGVSAGVGLYSASDTSFSSAWETWSVSTTGQHSLQTLGNVLPNVPLVVAFWNGTGTTGLDNVSVTAVPEPSSGLLLLASVASFAVVRRRR